MLHKDFPNNFLLGYIQKERFFKYWSDERDPNLFVIHVIHFFAKDTKMSDKLPKRCKRSFLEAWLTDDRYKSWLRRASGDNFYYCTICQKNISITSTHVLRHVMSKRHQKNKRKNSICKNDDENSSKVFLLKWLEIEKYKCWLRKVPQDSSLFFCSICDKTIGIGCGLSQIERHAESEGHLKLYKNIELNKSNEELNMEVEELLAPFDERKKEAEIRYAALIAMKNISHQVAQDILNFFQHLADDPKVLKNMTMGTKCTNMIKNVLYPVEQKRVVENIQNTKFSIFIDETSDITNDKWMTFLVRYIDSETLDLCVQLVKLNNIDARDSSAKKLFYAFQSVMNKLEIPFVNILALSCDNASVMTEMHKS